MIYGFIVDEALYDWSSNALLSSAVDQGAGYASENVLEFFNQAVEVRDVRASRYAYLGSGITMYGKVGLIVDNLPPNSEGGTDDNENAVAADKLNYAGLTDTDLSKIFNIIEDVLYYRSGSGTDLIANFLNVRFTSSSNYSGYVAGSLSISSENSSMESFMSGIHATSSDKNTVTASNLSIPYWMSFTYTTENIGNISFKLWISRESFLADYPLTTICDIVLPCEAQKLATPSLFDTPINTLVSSGTFINNIVRNNLATKESTGSKVFTSSYFPDTYSSVSIPFGVIYKGAIPDSSLCKKAIRNALLATSISEDIWTVAFPDLFIANKFFLVPIWDNVFASAGVSVDHGITKMSHILEKLQQVFPNYNESLMNAHLEIILNDATNLLVAVIPWAENDMTKWLKTIHSTYVPVDATNNLWGYQEASTKTFNRNLGYAIADSIRGTITHTEVTEEVVNCGTSESQILRKFLFFSWNHTEYYLLDKGSWATLA